MKKKASKVNMVEMGQVKPAPPHQGKIRLDSKTKIEIPICVTDIPAWEAKVREKHRNKDRVNALKLLTGTARNRIKQQL